MVDREYIIWEISEWELSSTCLRKTLLAQKPKTKLLSINTTEGNLELTQFSDPTWSGPAPPAPPTEWARFREAKNIFFLLQVN